MSLDNLRTVNLDNGMRIICRRNEANPTVSFSLRFSSGSALDPVEKTGLSSFAGSLITKGTESRTPAEIALNIDNLGMEMGFSAGKHTSSLSGKVLSENLKKGLELSGQVLFSPQPPMDEMERMRQRILTGITMQMDDPAAVAMDRLMEMLYGPDHPYGTSMKKSMETIPGITLDDINHWYESSLKPGGVVGVVVGDIDLDNIDKLLKSTLGKWQGEGSFEVAPLAGANTPAEPVKELLAMPGKSQCDIALGFAGIDRYHPDYYALQVGNTIMGRMGLGGRVGQKVRDKEGMAYYAYTYFDAGVTPGPYIFRAGVNPVNVEKAIEYALEEMGKVAASGVTREELDDAVIYMTGGMARQVETNSGMAGIIMQQDLFGLGEDFYLRYPGILKALSLEDVNKAMNTHVKTGSYCLAIAGPQG